MKLGVGLIDADERNWLHNGVDFYEKMIDINLAYQVDLVVADAMKMNTGIRTDPKDEVTPGIITASSNMVVSDAVSYGLMKYYNTARVRDHKALEHIQFRLAERLSLGSPNITDIEFMNYNYHEDDDFEKVIEHIITELT
jgi:uncharacterized protein (DUF362 family)